MMKQYLLALLIIFITLPLSAQKSVNTAGGDVSNSTGSVSYSVGQVVFSSFSGNGAHITEGVQHPFEIFIITSITDPAGLMITLSVFPNPVTELLTLEIESPDQINPKEFHYRLVDMNGKVLKYKQVKEETTVINMGGHQPGMYFLQVTGNERHGVGLYKIIKR